MVVVISRPYSSSFDKELYVYEYKNKTITTLNFKKLNFIFTKELFSV